MKAVNSRLVARFNLLTTCQDSATQSATILILIVKCNLKKMERIELFKLERPDIKISMELYFNEKGQLIFDGYDIGKTVDEWWGDSDYEYGYTIEPQQVVRIFSILGIENNDRISLFKELKNRFEGNGAYTTFGNFLNENKIEYTASRWA